MKKIYASILTLTLFLSLPGRIFADTTTSYIHPTTTGAVHNQWTNPTNGYLLDGSYATTQLVNGQQKYQTYGFDFSAYSSKTPTGFSGTIRYKVNDTSCARSVAWDLYKGTTLFSSYGFTPSVVSNWSGTTDQTSTFSISRATNPTAWDSFWTSAALTGVVNLDVNFSNGSCTQTYSMDNVYLALTYSTPTTSISQSIASPSAQLLYLDLHGDTTTKSANMQCTIYLNESCQSTNPITGLASFKSPSSVAKIHLDSANPRSTTLENSIGDYDGFGFSATSSAWTANHVAVPYEDGYTCSYVPTTTCYHSIYDCSSGTNCVRTSDITDVNFTGDAFGSVVHSAQQNIVAPDPATNPLGWVIYQLRQMAGDLFVPNFRDTIFAIDDLKTNYLAVRAPFAYAYAISNLNLTNITEATTFTLNYPIWLGSGTGNGAGNHYLVAVTMPTEMDSFMAVVKPVLSWLLYGGFIVYLVSVARRIF